MSDEDHLGELIAFLEDVGYRSQRVGAREVLVAPAPSSKRLDVLRLDLDLHLRAWQAAHRGVTVRQT